MINIMENMVYYKDTIENYAQNGIPHPCNSCYDCTRGNGCNFKNRVKIREHKRVARLVINYITRIRESEGE